MCGGSKGVLGDVPIAGPILEKTFPGAHWFGGRADPLHLLGQYLALAGMTLQEQLADNAALTLSS